MKLVETGITVRGCPVYIKAESEEADRRNRRVVWDLVEKHVAAEYGGAWVPSLPDAVQYLGVLAPGEEPDRMSRWIDKETIKLLTARIAKLEEELKARTAPPCNV